jgi:hypothetical protein
MVQKAVRMVDNASENGGARIAAVMTAVRQCIAARTLARGDKVPSIRATAGAMKVSISKLSQAHGTRPPAIVGSENRYCTPAEVGGYRAMA